MRRGALVRQTAGMIVHTTRVVHAELSACMRRSCGDVERITRLAAAAVRVSGIWPPFSRVHVEIQGCSAELRRLGRPETSRTNLLADLNNP